MPEPITDEHGHPYEQTLLDLINENWNHGGTTK